MSNRFFISDTHFNHERALIFTDKVTGRKIRGEEFEDVRQMNETMIYNWNAVVKPNDIVWHLGDVYFGPWGEANAILYRLNGRKKLILGNHDHLTPEFTKHFEDVVLWKPEKKDGFVFSHMPLAKSVVQEMGQIAINVHGHIHQNDSPVDTYGYEVRWVNICVEKTNYAPVPFEALEKLKKDGGNKIGSYL
jgi:calcineurin-like phosphoesterase family protein